MADIIRWAKDRKRDLGEAVDVVARGASRAYDQVNVFDNNRTWQQRTPTQNKSNLQQAGQVAGQTARTVAGNSLRLANTANLGARQAANTVKLFTAQASNNPVAFRNANQASIDDYNRFSTKGGLLNAGTVFKSPQEAARGDFRTAATRIGGGTLGTAAEVLPVARGGSFATKGMALRRALPRVAAEGAAYGAAGSVGNQLVQNGSVNPLQTAKDTVLGAGLGAGTLGAIRGAQRAAPVVQQGAQRTAQAVREADRRAFRVPTAQTPVAQAAVAQGGYVAVPGATNRPVGASTLNMSPDTVTTGGSKTRGFVESVRASDDVSGPTKVRTTGTYDVRNTSELQQRAEQFAAGDINQNNRILRERLDTVQKGFINDSDVANTIAHAKRLDAEGDFDAASDYYEKLAEHLTAAGQTVQAASLLSRRTPEGIQFQAQRAIKKAGKTLTPEQQQRLKLLIDNVRNTPEGSPDRLRATYEVTRFVNDQVPSGTADRIMNLWRAGLLTAPTTTFGNITGNLGENIIRKGFVNPVAAATDKLLSIGTGKRTQTLAPLGSGAEGFVEGAKKLPDFIKTGYDERNAINKYDNRETNYGNSPAGKVAAAYVNAVYRLMGTADQPFYYNAHRTSLGSLAKSEAINRGLKGDARNAFINDFMDNPPKEAAERAAQEAAFATFQNKTGLGAAAVAFKEGLNKVVPGAGDFIVPFTQVPASIATRIVTRTPVGTAIEVAKQIIDVRRGGKFDQRALAQSVGEGAFGAAVLGAGYALANSGMMTFGYPSDEKERKLWESEGKQPYSLKVGNRWYSLNYIQPFGTLLSVGAKAGEKIEQGENLFDAVMTSIGTAGQSVANQSFVKGVSGAIDAITDPERSVEKFVNQSAASIIPNLLRSITRSFDDVQREQAGFKEGIMQGIPGLRDNTPAKLGIDGNPLPAKDNPANQLLNPLKPSIDRSGDPVLNELRRLQDEGLGVLPTQINKNVFGKDTEITKDQIRELQGNIGREVDAAWSELVKTDKYKSLSDEEKRAALASLTKDVNAVQKRAYAAENQLGEYSADAKKEPKALSERQQDIQDGEVDVASYAKSKEEKERPSSDDYYKSPDAEYKAFKKEYDKDKKAGKISTIKDISRTAKLKKLEVGSKFDKDIRDLYGLGKEKVYNFITGNENGKKFAEKLLAYGDALVEAGIETKNKFRSQYGGKTTSSKKSGSGKSGKKRTAGVNTALLSTALQLPKVGRAYQSTISAKGVKLPSFTPPKVRRPKVKTDNLNRLLGATKVS